MPVTYKLISTVTVSTATQAALTISNIPATFDDIVVKLSVRNDNTTLDSHPSMLIKVNTSTSNLSYRILYGTGSATASASGSTGYISSTNNNNTTTSTANTFSNVEIYFPNYAGSTNKSYSVDSTEEHNGITAYAVMNAGLWSQTTAINELEFYVTGANWLQHTSAYIYGIKRT